MLPIGTNVSFRIDTMYRDEGGIEYSPSNIDYLDGEPYKVDGGDADVGSQRACRRKITSQTRHMSVMSRAGCRGSRRSAARRAGRLRCSAAAGTGDEGGASGGRRVRAARSAS
jgi:hypothetical protein